MNSKPTALYEDFDSAKRLGVKFPDVPKHIRDNLRYELRPYQEEAISRWLHYMDYYPNKKIPVQLLFDMATGSGKTLIMAAQILDLYKRGYRNFIYFVNSTNIIEKTISNFAEPSSSKCLFTDSIVIDGENVRINPVSSFNESALAAMRVGAEHGFTMFEYDVKLSRDNVLVLMHDDDVDRTSNGHGPAAAKTFSELAQLDFGSWHSAAYAGEPLPTFAAVARYTVANGIASNVEIKPCPGREAETGAAVALAARELWKGAAVAPLLSSFAEEALQAAKDAAPELPRALLVEKVPADWLDRLVKYDCVALNINQKDATRELIDAVHAAGYRIAAWTVNDPERARLLLDWGIDGIFTDELAAIRPAA